MTVATEASYAERAWTGTETSFSPGISAQSPAHIFVSFRDAANVVVPLVQGVNITVTKDGAAGQTGAISAVPLALPPAPGTVIFTRRTPALQGTNFADLEKFSAALHTALHDAAAMRDAEGKRDLADALLGNALPLASAINNDSTAPGGTVAESLEGLDGRVSSNEDSIVAINAQIAITAINPPKVTRYASGSGVHMPTAGCKLIRWRAQGGGGAGAGNNASNVIPDSQRGERGGDTWFDAFDPDTATISIATPAVVNIPGYTPIANQPLAFTTTGALPTGIVAGTAYFIIGSSISGNSFQISTRPSIPFPGDVQPPVATSGTQSGVHSCTRYRYVAQGGGGGGIVGDQGTPLSYIGADALGPAGYKQSFGLQGGAGKAIYGQNIAGADGGVSPFGGNSGSSLNDFGINGANQTGAGGGGAGATRTSSGGASGASGSYAEGWLKPEVGGHPYKVGAGGLGGPAGAIAATMTIASPCEVTSAAHGFGGGEDFTFSTTGALPTGVVAGTTYYALFESITADTFRFAASLNGAAINTSGTQSGVHTIHSGYVGGNGGHGQLVLEEFFGLI